MIGPDEPELDADAARARASREALIGKTIASKYVLRGLVGHGGMGAVYEAEHVKLGKRVAIKFVDPEYATDENVVARFAREARAMSAVESAHIVTVFDAGSEDGRPYLVMELLRGEDLGQRLRRERRMDRAAVMHIAAQVLKGLARAHAAGIVHRDLKPDNVFLVRHDTDPLFAKIVDFGVSKIERPRATTSPLALTGRGTVLGTPFYMSPEQAQASSEVDARADLYSVGAIVFECLTGRPPHTGESYEQVILSICMRDAPSAEIFDASIPANVSAFLARALARDRTQRFPSAERMLAALHEVAPDERTRVPIEPGSPLTLLSPTEKPTEATLLDGGSRRSAPAAGPLSAATRLGGGALVATDPNEFDPSPVAAHPHAEVPRPKVHNVTAAAVRKPIGAVLVTAVLATLTGILVMFAVITLLDRRSGGSDPATSAATGGRPGEGFAAKSATPAAPAPAISETLAIASAPSGASAASSAASEAGPAIVRASSPRPPSASAGARPGRPLDIQRDLP